VADVLTSRKETTIVQGFYVHRISALARSKKVVGAIILVSGQIVLLYHTQDLKNTPNIFAPYTALLHSTWGWDSGWGPSAANEILHPGTRNGDPLLYDRWCTNHLAGSLPCPNDITLQIWNVGGVLCDIIIAVCMTYYVCFLISPYFLWRVIRFRPYLTAFAR